MTTVSVDGAVLDHGSIVAENPDPSLPTDDVELRMDAGVVLHELQQSCDPGIAEGVSVIIWP